jgi:hypothetical protein
MIGANSLVNDFAAVRAPAFRADETRKLADMWRSGAATPA